MKLRRFLYGALLTLQAGLVLTGGAVRITGSGLGCPTWPECTPGSYTPVPHQAEGQLHAWIEFGNRLLTFALVAVALAVLINVLYRQRRDLRSLALGQVLGILGQGILGGITVLTDLHPLPVAGHLLLSIILIAGAASLYSRREYSARPRTDLDNLTKRVSVLHIGLTFVVIILGTIVTGSGPHAGDKDAPRLKLDERAITWLHADAVIALFGVSLALLVLSEISPETKRRVKIFFAITLAQGFVGYAQYVLGLPELLVVVHVLGSTLVWIASWRIWLSITTAERT